MELKYEGVDEAKKILAEKKRRLKEKAAEAKAKKEGTKEKKADPEDKEGEPAAKKAKISEAERVAEGSKGNLNEQPKAPSPQSSARTHVPAKSAQGTSSSPHPKKDPVRLASEKLKGKASEGLIEKEKTAKRPRKTNPKETKGATSKATDKDKKKQGDPVSVRLPHHKVMMQEISQDLSTSDAAPPETSSYALGVFENFAPRCLQNELNAMPLEPIAHRLVRDLLFCGVRAAHLVRKVTDFEAMQYGEAPVSLVEAWEAEKGVLMNEKEALEKDKKNLIDEKAKLEEEKKEMNATQSRQVEEVEGLKLELNKVSTNLKERDLELVSLREANKQLLEENKKLSKEVQSFPLRESSFLQTFLSSEAFRNAALSAAQPALRDALYTSLLALSCEYPFQPEELNVKEGDGGPLPDFSAFSWDREKDVLVSPDGEALVPKSVLPNLENLKLKHPWIGNYPWPSSDDEAGSPEEVTGEDNQGKANEDA